MRWRDYFVHPNRAELDEKRNGQRAGRRCNSLRALTAKTEVEAGTAHAAQRATMKSEPTYTEHACGIPEATTVGPTTISSQVAAVISAQQDSVLARGAGDAVCAGKMAAERFETIDNYLKRT